MRWSCFYFSFFLLLLFSLLILWITLADYCLLNHLSLGCNLCSHNCETSFNFLYIMFPAPLPVSLSHSPSLSPPLLLLLVGISLDILLNISLQVSEKLAVSSPLRPEMEAQLEEYISHTGRSFWDNPCSSCSGTTWRPSYTSDTYIQGKLGRNCLCSLVDVSDSEGLKDPVSLTLLLFRCGSHPVVGLQSFLQFLP